MAAELLFVLQRLSMIPLDTGYLHGTACISIIAVKSWSFRCLQGERACTLYSETYRSLS